MNEIGARLLRLPQDTRSCLAFFTRLPIAASTTLDLSAASAAWPIVGITAGAVAALVLAAAHALALPALVAAAAAIATLVGISGGLHEDGLADTADGIGGGRGAEAKLAIMRDSRIGTYGVLALALTLLIRVGALASLSVQPGRAAVAIIAAAAISRGLAMWHWDRVPSARLDGLARQAGSPDRPALAIATLIGGICVVWGLAVFGWTMLLGLILAAAGVALLSRLCRRAINGHTGDTIGAAQQVAETLLLAALSSHLAGI